MKEPTVPVTGLSRECVLLVCGGVVDQNIHGAELGLCNIEQALRCLRIGEVGLYCRGLSSFRMDCANNVSGASSPYAYVRLWPTGHLVFANSQVGDEYSSAALGQDARGGSTDAVIRAGDYRYVAGLVKECHWQRLDTHTPNSVSSDKDIVAVADSASRLPAGCMLKTWREM